MWEQLAVDKAHWAYTIIGGFTSLFMLCSLFVKERLYIGEATIATICGLIFGPHAANLFNPLEWGNTDKITLECSRIVLVVQCFAVGVELPKAYMERHWKSVALMLGPVMTFGWLVTSLFIWWMVVPLTWLESLALAACVTATDPVLASSVVGKGKFAKRVPRHLRDVLSAESGCNDGMAFPFIYLSLYLIHYHLEGRDVVFHWVCFTILYECIFGAVYGFLVGYIGRHLIKTANRYGVIDRESFLVFYFVLALFCAGSASSLGLDDLLVGFAAGVGFSNDGWFTEQTEESHVSNVIDLLLNLTYFVYLGAVIPWDQFNNLELGMEPWRLVVIAIFVMLFRRLPIVLALKPIIPDVKNWREALFAGHFGPIGVGAIFAAILTRAELETGSTQPLAVLPGPETEHFLLASVIWPVVTFLVVTSILVHGSSIAVFTLGKRINTLTLTMSYTTAQEPSWMNRLPRIASTSKSMSKSKADYDSSDEALPQFPPGTLPPIGIPGNFLRRQREEDEPSRSNSRASSLKSFKRKKWESGFGPGGPISQSAITPQRRSEQGSAKKEKRGSEDEIEKQMDDSRSQSPPAGAGEKVGDGETTPERRQDESARDEPEVEAYEEGDELIVEDEEGNVLRQQKMEPGRHEQQEDKYIEEEKEKLKKETSGEHAKHKHEPHARDEGSEIEAAVAEGLHHPSHPYHNLRNRLKGWQGFKKKPAEAQDPKERRGAAHAYQYGHTIIVEDEDGEVVKKYDISSDRRKSRAESTSAGMAGVVPIPGIRRMTTFMGRGARPPVAEPVPEETEDAQAEDAREQHEYDDDDRIRFTLGGSSQRMCKSDFIKQIQALDPKAQARAVDSINASEPAKEGLKREVAGNSSSTSPSGRKTEKSAKIREGGDNAGDTGLALVDSHGQDIPVHSMSDTLSRYSMNQPESAAQRRRRLAGASDSGNGEGPSRERRPDPAPSHSNAAGDDVETAAERRRRLAALGQGNDDSDSDEDGGERQPRRGHRPVEEPITPRSQGVRFAETPAISQSRVQWGENVSGRPGRKR